MGGFGGGEGGGPEARRKRLALEGMVSRRRGILGALSGGSPERERTFQGGLIARLALLCLAGVVVQSGVVSELPIFGSRVDITPLIVAFAGFLCGSVAGAICGFCVGLLVDLALVQTLGLTSLLYTGIGYASGRLRELRDPQATLLPLALGAFAAFSSLAGYTVIEFLLGVDAPVSALELLRGIVLGTVVDAIVAAPAWLLVRRLLTGGIEEHPQRRRRRAYTTGGLSPLSRP